MTEKDFKDGLFSIIIKSIPEPDACTTGLFILPGATESGKSHAVCTYIAKHAGDWREKGLKIDYYYKRLKH